MLQCADYCQLCEGDTDTGHGHGNHTLVFILRKLLSMNEAVRLKIFKLLLQMDRLKILSYLFYAISNKNRSKLYIFSLDRWHDRDMLQCKSAVCHVSVVSVVLASVVMMVSNVVQCVSGGGSVSTHTQSWRCTGALRHKCPEVRSRSPASP